MDPFLIFRYGVVLGACLIVVGTVLFMIAMVRRRG